VLVLLLGGDPCVVALVARRERLLRSLEVAGANVVPVVGHRWDAAPATELDEEVFGEQERLGVGRGRTGEAPGVLEPCPPGVPPGPPLDVPVGAVRAADARYRDVPTRANRITAATVLPRRAPRR